MAQGSRRQDRKGRALLEISTDKVDAEVPSPAAGTLLAINVQEGETVEVGSVLALVGAEGSVGRTAVGKTASRSSAVQATAPADAAAVHIRSRRHEPLPPRANGGANGNADARRASPDKSRARLFAISPRSTASISHASRAAASADA